MKFNWGTGIAIFYSCFVIAMVSMVVKSFNHQSHLVKEDYYELDLGYEEYRQKRQNAQKMEEPVAVSFNKAAHSLELGFPADMNNVKGDVHLFRPSNKYLDKRYNLKLGDSKNMSIALEENMLKGLWKVKLDWESDGVAYYKETDLVL